MSKPQDITAVGNVPLPSPVSPPDLDERILRAAREQAPVPPSARQPWWLAGVATASVLVIAVTVAIQSPPPVSQSLEETEPATKKEMALMADAPADSAMSKQKRAHKQSADMEMSAHAAPSPAASRLGVASESIVEKVSRERAEASEERTSLASADKLDLSAGTLQDTLSSEKLSEQIQVLAGLLSGGEEDQARQGYVTLGENCGCTLPKTLEEAISQYLESGN